MCLSTIIMHKGVNYVEKLLREDLLLPLLLLLGYCFGCPHSRRVQLSKQSQQSPLICSHILLEVIKVYMLFISALSMRTPHTINHNSVACSACSAHNLNCLPDQSATFTVFGHECNNAWLKLHSLMFLLFIFINFVACWHWPPEYEMSWKFSFCSNF